MNPLYASSDLTPGINNVVQNTAEGVADSQDKTINYDTLSADNINDGYADIIRGDFDDWQKTFEPFEDYQTNMVLDPALNNQLKTNALGYVDKSTASAVGQTKANMHMNDRKFGRQLGADEKKARQRRLGSQATLTKSSGRTDMRQALNDRKVNMLSGGV